MPRGNIAQRLGLQPAPVYRPCDELHDSTRSVGIEIEVENVRRNDIIRELGHMWEVTIDGSLRPRDRSAELRSPVPGYAGKSLVDSVDILQGADSLVGGSFSWRAATHAHVDVRDKTANDLLKLSIIHCLIEPFIFAWDGHGRHESRFSMPWWVCGVDTSTFRRAVDAENDEDLHRFLAKFSKYTSLNMAPLVRQGTIEFRHAQSTADKRTLLEFINMCFDICNVDKLHKGMGLVDIVLEYIEEGPDFFISKWMTAETAEVLTRQPVGGMPLVRDVFDRTVSTALTLAELCKHNVKTPAGSSVLKTLKNVA